MTRLAVFPFAATWLTISTKSIALDGYQWQQLIPDGKLLYVTGVLESWIMKPRWPSG
jgi:hypothetical protein